MLLVVGNVKETFNHDQSPEIIGRARLAVTRKRPSASYNDQHNEVALKELCLSGPDIWVAEHYRNTFFK